MSLGGKWAGHLELTALCRLYRIRVIVIPTNPKDAVVTCGGSGLQTLVLS